MTSSSSYGTRRASQTLQQQQQQASPIAISTSSGASPSTSLSTSTSLTPRLSSSLSLNHSHSPTSSILSSSVGKSRRQPTTALARRRLSSSASQQRPSPKQQVQGLGLDVDEALDEGEIKPGSKREKGQIFECEKCSKVYRHSTCLVKHRWEHTAHWKEASKLLLSKHQQVQLLEAAAILKATATGTSLPEEKSFWPAAVSPPSSGLLGSQSLNINVLSTSSPRIPMAQLSLRDLSDDEEDDLEDDDEDDEDEEEDEEEEDDSQAEDTSSPAESGSTGDEGMFDMDLDEGVIPAHNALGVSVSTIPPSSSGRASSSSGSAAGGGRGSSVGGDSGYGSVDAKLGSAPSSIGTGPVLGFFEGRNGGRVV
ncbi:hypothetical protein T439DRAFT_322841 [Meredithblackwellia eburnea MCA 4105]